LDDGTAAGENPFPSRTPGRLARIFPERELIFRTDGRVRYMTLSTRGQSAIAVVVLVLVGWFAFSISVQMQLDETIAGKDREIAAISVAYGDFKDRLDNSESRFRSVARTLEAKHAYLMALLDRQMSSGDAPKARAAGRHQEDLTRRRLESSRRALLAQLGALEGVLERKAGPGGEVKEAALKDQGTVPLSGPERTQLGREHKRLISRIDRLEQRLLTINGSQRGVMNFLAAQSIDDFDRAKKLVAVSGLDVDGLLARLARADTRGQGGPFIAAAPDTGAPVMVPAALGVIDNQLDRWEALGVLISRLPLVAPTDRYSVASRFGKRRDPINRRWAMHYGLDLRGVYRSPVRATAPGVVVKVGWNGSYGRVVEIDHGLGIRTRYGHLRRSLVKRGQKVGFRQKIGQMGKSGRSTGIHVHYEILVNGKPRNPAKFMEAGKHVLEGY
jgi:murein DD-endopeptidase MepM/ murein hydrolase activator NlpD